MWNDVAYPLADEVIQTYRVVGNVAMVSEGTGLEQVDSGDIVISGIPAGATLIRAFLYYAGRVDPSTWDDLLFDGTLINETTTPWAKRIAETPDNGDRTVFRADITGLLPTDGSSLNKTYTLVPEANMSGIFGASLVIVYEDMTRQLSSVIISDGAAIVNANNPVAQGPGDPDSATEFFSQTDLVFPDELYAKITMIVSEGSVVDDTELIVIPDYGTPKNFGDLCNGSDGTNWDDVTDDFSNHLNVQSTRVDMIYTDKDQGGYFADLYVFAMQYALKDGTLAGFVFNDLNRNDMYEPALGESPLQGISITIFGESTATLWTETNAQGYWSQAGLSPETYWVFADESDPDIPPGFIFNTADNPAVAVLPDGGAVAANFGWLRYPSEVNFTDASQNVHPYWYSGESLYVTVTDCDEDTDSQTLQTITGVTVWDERTQDSETIGVLVETAPGSGIFTSNTSLDLQTGPPVPGDGVLQVYGGDPIYCGYRDDDYPADLSMGDGVIITSTGYTFYMTADTVTAYAGDMVTYTIGVLNSSSSSMTDAVILNTIPSGADYVAQSMTVNGSPQTDAQGDDMAAYESAADRVIFNVPALEPGQYAVMTMELRMEENALTWTEVTAQASLQSTALGIDALSDADPEMQPGDQPVIVDIIGDLCEFAKDVSAGILLPMETACYSLVLYNSCTASFTQVHVEDPVPEELDYLPGSLSWNSTPLTDASADDAGTFSSGTVQFDIPSLDAGEACTFYFSVRVPADALSLTNISNQATVDVSTPHVTMLSDGDPVVQGRQSTDITVSGPWYSFAMTVDPDTLPVGETVQWMMVLRNSCTISFDVIDISAPVPGGMSYIPGTLKEGDESLTDQAGDDDGSFEGQNANFSIPALASGASVTFYFSSSVVPGTWTGSMLATHADVSVASPVLSGRSDSDPLSPGDQDTQVTVSGPLVSFAKTARAWARPGESVPYNIILENTSTTSLDTVTVSDPVPSGAIYDPGTLSFNGAPVSDAVDSDEGSWDGSGTVAFDFARLDPGESATMGFSLRMEAGLPSGTVVSNQAVVNAADPVLLRGSDSDPAAPGLQNTDLTITSELYRFLKFGPSCAMPGEQTPYRLVFESTTTADFDSVSISDPVPEGMQYAAGTLKRDSTVLSDAADSDEGSFAGGTITFDLPVLLSGMSTTLYYTLQVDDQAVPGTVIANQAGFTAISPGAAGFSDSDAGTPDAEAHSLLVIGEKNQVLSLDVDPDRVCPGGLLDWTLSLTNTSATLMDGIVLNVPVPADTDVRPGSLKVNGVLMTDATGDDHAGFSSMIVYFRPDAMDPGQTVDMNFSLDVHSPLPAGTLLMGQAQMSSATPYAQGILSDGDAKQAGDQPTTAEVIFAVADPLIIWDNPVRSDNAVIAWNVPQASSVQIRIFTVTGELVGRWTDLAGASGFVTWHETNLGGKRVANGMYIVVLESTSQIWRKKMVVIR